MYQKEKNFEYRYWKEEIFSGHENINNREFKQPRQTVRQSHSDRFYNQNNNSYHHYTLQHETLKCDIYFLVEGVNTWWKIWLFRFLFLVLWLANFYDQWEDRHKIAIMQDMVIGQMKAKFRRFPFLSFVEDSLSVTKKNT